jgi:hypothetical protein
MFALGREEVRPGNNFGVLLEQRTALPLGHPTPHAELDPVVQGIGSTFEDHRAVPADHCGFALSGAADEEFIRIGLPAPRLRYPCDPSFGLGAVRQTVSRSRCGRCGLARDSPCL